MAHGKDAARDLRYGRRGGRWADDSAGQPRTGPPCEKCGKPMLHGQVRWHVTCEPADTADPQSPPLSLFDL